jgi:hypothetical protein
MILSCAWLLVLVSPVHLGQAGPVPPPHADPAAIVRQVMSPPPPSRLLREGSFLTRVRGTMHQDQASGWWRFQTAGDEPSGPAHRFIILPNRKLQEMRETVAATGGDQVIFELSGEVFRFGDENFVLATHAPRLVGYQAPGDAAAAPAAPDDSVEAIMQRLTAAVGPLRRSSSLARGEAGAAEEAAGARDGEPLVARRGVVSRDPSGAFVFHLEADGPGPALDPPLLLLPCQLLERLAVHLAQAARPAPLLVSGRQYHFDGRRYLLPTVYRVPHERTPLRPRG